MLAPWTLEQRVKALNSAAIVEGALNLNMFIFLIAEKLLIFSKIDRGFLRIAFS